MKKVLIIGAKGTLGQELVKVFLADKNYQVVAWDKEEIDITDEPQVEEKIFAQWPRVIINAAAYNNADKAENPDERERVKEVNAQAPFFLALVARRLGAAFVHYSSDYIFSGEKIEGYKENDTPFPLSFYGHSKLLGEQLVEKAGGYFYIIRLQRLFGLPAASAEAKKSFFELMLCLAKNKKEIEVVDEEISNFTYAPDLALRTKYLLEGDFLPGIYHSANEGQPATWYGAVKILFEMAGVKDVKLIPVPTSRFPRPAKRPKYSVLLNTKLPPLRPWNEALKEFLGK